MRRQRGFTLIELMVGSAVTLVTVLAVSAAFLGYTQSFYTQAGIRGAQASLRQTHQMVVRNLRMAGYGIDPPNAFGFPAGWSDDASRNRSDRLVFRMRNPSFKALALGVSTTSITLSTGLSQTLRKGQVIQVMCAGALAWNYGRLSVDAPKGSMGITLEPASGSFPNTNYFTEPCFTSSEKADVYIFKVDIYDYSIQLVDDDGDPLTPGRPYLFRRHGLSEGDPDAYGEPVAEDIEALRVTYIRADGSAFKPNPADPAPTYTTPLDDDLRKNNNPANIRAVRVALVARTSTRDLGVGPGYMDRIPKFADRPELPGPYGFRRVLSEMSVQVRNMSSAEMSVPVYTLDTTTTGVCKGTLPSDNFNCAGG